MRQRVIKWLFRRIFGELNGTLSCANRAEWIYTKDGFETTIVRRDTTKPDMYSREELYHLAQIIRKEQARTGWDVFSCFDSPTSVK